MDEAGGVQLLEISRFDLLSKYCSSFNRHGEINE
jgi:hypothetical protein